MSTSNITEKQAKKWINAGVAVTCIIMFYVLTRFFLQISEWFELEARLPYYAQASQGLSALVSLAAFIVTVRHPVSSKYLAEAFGELVKVVFPDRNETMNMTFKIMILVTIVGFILGFFDWGSGYLMSLLPQM
ncbi:MAG: preprotein translocase subunit SecE [Halobacteriovoraceae bacterium]|nr:preprotein translocase subunit SecE [Halobacteriovoraceae bacterium]